MSSVMTSMVGIPGRPSNCTVPVFPRIACGTITMRSSQTDGFKLAQRELTARHVEGDPPHAHRMHGDGAGGEASGRAHRHAPSTSQHGGECQPRTRAGRRRRGNFPSRKRPTTAIAYTAAMVTAILTIRVQGSALLKSRGRFIALVFC